MEKSKVTKINPAGKPTPINHFSRYPKFGKKHCGDATSLKDIPKPNAANNAIISGIVKWNNVGHFIPGISK